MKNLLIVISLFFIQLSFAQNEKISKDSIYPANVLSKVAKYPGKTSDFYKYVSKNLKIPETFSGKLIINFVVEIDGKLTLLDVVNGDDNFNKDIAAILSKSKKWSPSEYNNQPVRSKLSLPIAIKQPQNDEVVPFK